MYANRPHQGELAGESGRPYAATGDQRTIDGATRPPAQASFGSSANRPHGPIPAVDVAVALQRMPYSDMVTFSLSLARDLLQRDDPAAVSRVAEALIATAQVWHTAD